jgi:hypothetical protein
METKKMSNRRTLAEILGVGFIPPPDGGDHHHHGGGHGGHGGHGWSPGGFYPQPQVIYEQPVVVERPILLSSERFVDLGLTEKKTPPAVDAAPEVIPEVKKTETSPTAYVLGTAGVLGGLYLLLRAFK